MDNNLMREEAERLPFTAANERTAMINALDAIAPGVVGQQSFDQLYDAVIYNMQNILAVLTRYESGLDRAERDEKRARAAADSRLSNEINPQTGKAYTRGAIEAYIETDEEVINVTDARRDIKSIVRFCCALHEIYRLHYERIVNLNVNARREYSGQ